MTRLKVLALAAVVALFGAHAAQSHPYHPVAEEVMSFRHAGMTLTVVNTHQRGFLGGELIEIHNPGGSVRTSWWSNRGWCFTAHAINNHPCWHPDGYISLYKARMKGNQGTTVLRRPYGGGGASSSSDPCDHYSQLEYTVSGDTSGRCGHEDGLPLPSWY